MNIKEQIAKDLLSIGAVFLRPEDPFTWASGIKSPIYCDNRVTMSFPAVRKQIAQGLADLIKEKYPDAKIVFKPYVDAGVHNEDANWEEKIWEPISVKHSGNEAFVTARTFKTHFTATTFMQNSILLEGSNLSVAPVSVEETKEKIQFCYQVAVTKGQSTTIQKIGGYTVSMNHEDTILAAKKSIAKALEIGVAQLTENQKEAWGKIWEMSDITIDGDVKAQQGIRFNIFQLNQTYLGKDSRLNIGPKGFTGEKYGGSTYWDTEAYCIPFYMATKDQQVARNLLAYRYNQLDKAIENAEKLGFKNGAALYPMVTMNGEECHNEWEITFEEIHRNGAIAFAIYNYYRFTGDYSYIPEKGLEVLIGIARFWHQRANFSKDKNQSHHTISARCITASVYKVSSISGSTKSSLSQ